jgi:hypothetical protein
MQCPHPNTLKRPTCTAARMMQNACTYSVHPLTLLVLASALPPVPMHPSTQCHLPPCLHRFPGTLKTSVTYALPESGSHLDITMKATTSKATPVNLLGHAYFNLKGAGRGTILDHSITMPSSYYTPSAQVHLCRGSCTHLCR